MKIWVFSYHDKSHIEERVKSRIKLDKGSPDFIITFGGDGTILDSERIYPGVPKIPIKRSHICSRCLAFGKDEIGMILEKLEEGKFKLRDELKVDAVFDDQVITGLNEIQVRNKYPNKALRFSVDSGKELIGDGLLVATPYGSTAYYSALGYKPFQDGIRIGFNNVTKKMDSMELTKPIKVKVLREKGLLLADNDQKMIELKPGDVITIQKSKNVARFVEFKA